MWPKEKKNVRHLSMWKCFSKQKDAKIKQLQSDANAKIISKWNNSILKIRKKYN